MEIIFATGNADKLREIHAILAAEGVNASMRTMREAGFCGEIEETGTTFGENAMLKARAVHGWLLESGRITDDIIVLADDSGLVIDALDGAPGIYSARYLGEDTPYAEKNAEILRRMESVPEEKRNARFVCSVAAVFADGSAETVQGIMEGRIAYHSAGNNGFGYDPVFFLPEYSCTSAELAPEEKNRISHRGSAFCQIARILGQRGGED